MSLFIQTTSRNVSAASLIMARRARAACQASPTVETAAGKAYKLPAMSAAMGQTVPVPHFMVPAVPAPVGHAALLAKVESIRASHKASPSHRLATYLRAHSKARAVVSVQGMTVVGFLSAK